MEIAKVILHRLQMELKNPFTTSLGRFQKKDFFIVEVIDTDGNSGFGETVSFPTPWYTEETVETNLYIMEAFLIPLLFQSPITHPDEITERFQKVRRNNMAKAALEGAVWDLYAKRKNVPLAVAIGGERKAVDVGVSIGIQSDLPQLLRVIDQYVEEGYRRVKIKIKPGWDIQPLREIRRHFPDLALMADANSAYTLADIDHLKQLDELNLLMIEQPLAHDDFIDHAVLQEQLETPICLDESIHTFSDVRTAIQLGSCEIINIKVGRVGGLTEAKKIHDYCVEHNIPVWCGGMLEAGVGRAHSLAIATLPQFTLPGDISASSRYWERDIIEPAVTMKDGQVELSDQAGIGYAIDREALEFYRVDQFIYSK